MANTRRRARRPVPRPSDTGTGLRRPKISGDGRGMPNPKRPKLPAPKISGDGRGMPNPKRPKPRTGGGMKLPTKKRNVDPMVPVLGTPAPKRPTKKRNVDPRVGSRRRPARPRQANQRSRELFLRSRRRPARPTQRAGLARLARSRRR